jgi:Flp pilus assembly protein TadD
MTTPSTERLSEVPGEFFSIGSLVAASPAVRAAPASPESHYRAGRAAWHTGDTAEAGRHFGRAVAMAPDHPLFLCGLADWCVNTGDLAAALAHSARAFALDPDSPDVRISHASALGLSGDQTRAFRVIEPLISRDPCPVSAATLLAKFARRLDLEGAALALLTRLLNSSRLSSQDRADLHFSASELLDRLGRYDEAFAHATAGHNARRRPYDPALIRRQTELRLAYYTRHKLHSLPRATHGSRRPIFIIGMPRTGSTLVEQILSNHPDVHGAGEIAHLGNVISSFALGNAPAVRDYPACMESLSVGACNQLAARYLSGLSAINPSARHVTDKMLPNFLYLGVIATLFPDAHVIHCTRDPLDTCLSCYMTHFLFGHEYAQDLAHLADYYNNYQRLISHWRDTLKFPMIEVNYQRVVSNLEGEVRRLLEHLDLPWNPGCLSFQNNPRHVPTASVEQVRQPLYARSVARWRHYARHLSPLVDALR